MHTYIHILCYFWLDFWRYISNDLSLTLRLVDLVLHHVRRRRNKRWENWPSFGRPPRSSWNLTRKRQSGRLPVRRHCSKSFFLVQCQHPSQTHFFWGVPRSITGKQPFFSCPKAWEDLQNQRSETVPAVDLLNGEVRLDEHPWARRAADSYRKEVWTGHQSKLVEAFVNGRWRWLHICHLDREHIWPLQLIYQVGFARITGETASTPGRTREISTKHGQK